MELRAHQEELRDFLANEGDNEAMRDILVDCVPGGGKSMLPALVRERFPKLKIAWFVPRLSLARQAAVSMQQNFGIRLRESGNDVNPSRGADGFVTTVQSLMADPDLWAHELDSQKYILVIDELHHAKMDRDWNYSPLAAAVARLKYAVRLCMTGTLETNDNSLIFNVPYWQGSQGYELDTNSFPGKFISYSRQDALNEGAIVPVEFHHHDGEVKWKDRDGDRTCTLSAADRDEENQAVWTALRTDLADQLFHNCVNHWRSCGTRLLVVTADQVSARRYVSELRTLGIAAGLAISDEGKDAHKDIDAFREGGLPALVTCQMAYEGLDVPEITHIACLTHIRSTPWIEQMLARAWRAAKGKHKCWAHVPNDPKMNRVIERIRNEQDAVVPFAETSDRTIQNGARPESAFLPISGKLESVHAQMLDGTMADDEIRSELEELCTRHGIPIEKAMRALLALREASDLQPIRERTTADQENYLRVEISDLCRRADRTKRVEFGTHQKRLWRETRKSITEMTLKELERASTIAIRICS